MSNNIAKPIVVTGAGGRTGGVSTYVVELLRKQNLPVRAIVRREDERAEAIRKLGAEVVVADLTEIEDVHRAFKGCSRVYFSMPVHSSFLEASLLATAVAKHYKVEVFVNMSQLTTTLMSIDKFVTSPQARAHYLAEQALEWSGVPFVNIKPTIFLENPFFHRWAALGIANNELRLPFGDTRVNPIAAYDVARVIAVVLTNPTPYLGKGLALVGNHLQTLDEVAKDYSKALGRELKYVPVDLDEYNKSVIQKMVAAGFGDQHTGKHLYELAKILQVKGRQLHNEEVEKITGKPSMGVEQWVREHAEDFK